MLGRSKMERKRRPARRLEEVSHFFLSSQDRQAEAEDVRQKEVSADDDTPLSSSDDTSRQGRVEGASSAHAVEQHLCFVCSSKSLFIEKSFLACNLGVELARRDFSVGLIETTTLPNTFSFLGPFFSESTSKQRGASSTKRLPPLPTPDPLKLIDIPVDPRNSLKAVVLQNDLESNDSRILLNRVKNESDFLIINAPAEIFRFRKLISFVNPFFIVPITDDPEKLLESYLLIKRVSEGIDCSEFGLLMMEEGHCQKAEGAFHLMVEMAFNFLSATIRFLDTIPMGDDFSRSILTQTPLLRETANSPTSLSIRKLADSLIRRTQLSERNHQW